MNDKLLSKSVIASIFLTMLSHAAFAQVTAFNSPQGITEKCIVFPVIPGGTYSSSDLQKEKKFCQIDFYNNKTAMCAKTWSTSPAVMLYEVSSGSSADYEMQKCASRTGHEKIGKFKVSMNESTTSGTYSKASLLYYHLSRYFNTYVKIPVAVKRTLDEETFYSRVAKNASSKGAMNQAAWSFLRSSLTSGQNEKTKPDLYEKASEVYGVILRDQGERYGTEINGVRSAWGDAQNYDFQNTAAFTALRTEASLKEAIDAGVQVALRSPKLSADLNGSPSDVQMISWMRELTEITLLDYIFSQQDRIGNIDFKWEWLYLKDGILNTTEVESELPRKQMNLQMQAPAQIASFNPYLIQRTYLGDNDSGGKVIYANYTKRTKMLEGIRHYNAGVYKKLMNLNTDFSTQGAVYQYVVTHMKLQPNEVRAMVSNTKLAAQILKTNCQAGLLKFDLDLEGALSGSATESAIDCH